MAVYFKPSSSRTGKLAESMGSSLGQLLNMMTRQKLEGFHKQERADKTASGLMSLGVPQEIASNVSHMPDMLQKMFFQKHFGMGRSAGKSNVELEQSLRGLTGLGYSPEEAMQLAQLPNSVLTAAFKSRGFMPGSAKSKQPMPKLKKLSNKVIDSFLSKANGDPVKAKELARLAGYKVQ